MEHSDPEGVGRGHAERRIESVTAASYALHCSKLFVAAAVSLWCVDVCVNLHLPERLLLGPTLPGDARGYLGLLIADAQIAVALVAASCLAAALTGRRGNRAGEAVALLAATLAAVTLFVGMDIAWSPAPRKRYILVAAVGAAFAVWLAVRAGLARHASERFRLGEILLFTLCPALAVGFANRAIAQAVAGVANAALFHGAAALCALGLGLLVWQRRFERVRGSFGWLPAAFAMALAAASALELSGRGRSDRPERAAVEAGRPPIFLVVLDTVRADHLKLYGYARDTMPALQVRERLRAS